MNELAIEPAIVPGSRGVFDVVVDGQTVFSKQAEHRFPGHDEILDKLRALLR